MSSFGLRLEAKLCEAHQRIYGTLVDARSLHGVSCRRSAGGQPRHGLLNDTIWHAMNKASVQSTKEPTGLQRSDGKRPDGITLIPWAKGRCLTGCHGTGYIRGFTYCINMLSPAAAEHAMTLEKQKYATLSQTYEFVPPEIETSEVFNFEGLEFVKEIGVAYPLCH